MQVIRSKHSNHYCGPAALSLLTGRHVDDCAATLRRLLNRRRVTFVHVLDMPAALSQMGHNATPLSHHGTTLVGLTRLLRTRTPEQRFLVATTHHYLILCGRKIYDNHNPTGIFFGKYNHRRYRVKFVWEVSA
jgi:hypothetical protein